MNHRPFFTRAILLTLVLLVTSCAAPQSTPIPTSDPQACPTCAPQACPTSVPQACPTPAAALMPEMTSWRWQVAGAANAIVTYEPGDQCTLEIVSPIIPEDGFAIDVVAHDNTYLNYFVSISYLDPGKTIDDLKKLTDPINPPGYMHFVGMVVTTPMSRAGIVFFHEIDPTNGPLYITCQVEGPVARKFVGQLGPLEVLP